MNAQDLRAAKREMEEAIRVATASAVSKFRNKTGLSPSSITIQMLDYALIGDPELYFIVGDVRADVSL